MRRFFTIMFIPDREKKVVSFKVPRIAFKAITFGVSVSIIALMIFSYDYLMILQEVYKNKHLSIENKHLKEQIELFQMKINAITDDIDRINTFENKLRSISGIDKFKPQINEKKEIKTKINNNQSTLFMPKETILNDKNYLDLKKLYEQKIASDLGQANAYIYTKEWVDLSKESLGFATKYAFFDFQFSKIKKTVKDIEININELDQYLLDRQSFLRSTPMLLPTKGWITSFYGPRKSPYAKRIKMHEGIDIGARPSSNIIATADGKVTFSGKKPGFGYIVKLDHGYGVETIYAHAKKLTVKHGTKVERGDLIAKVGSTGYSTGPHVHYEVRVNGTPVDPLNFILQ